MSERDSDGHEYQTGSESEQSTRRREPRVKRVVTSPNTADKGKDNGTDLKETSDSKPLVQKDDDIPPKGPWGNRGVTSPNAGTKRAPQKDSSLNVRINLDLRADVALELHAVLQGDITIGLF
ncbi:hypothetical protein BJY01DRAFT_246793 [Aspergillus pseudoustus]|uniref:Uncharacterized protein n=1 Tax=Aspergillus pseudoustus TaxID=1810923 RepID=A0ABR4K529_9EURO